ncbi:apolipoprotein D and lipocalin family protein [Roseovarius litoreus]|uniref:Apolipoprotein D and lipocalin family protein n=1 Tax=Roseovarius litoreus TaxID=1155722 RepID=A0A1M6ZP48_9RHOB|nr:lipocalin family protein [Roseovarius litoreus]SHL32159.1 apolipoprotein D and lipocalin family protein [Roseovarius litoreus]
MRAFLSAMLACVMLTACAQPPGNGVYRDTGQPLSVTTRSDASRLAGDWVVRSATPDEAGLTHVTYLGRTGADRGEAFALTRRVCDENARCELRRSTRAAMPLGMNRWRLAGDETPREIWVVWVDEGYRTAAIGTPDGSFGWILDRAATGGADRITAAREILEFNGYSAGALRARGTGGDT